MADITGSQVFKLSDFHHILIENDFHYNYGQLKPTSSGAFSEQWQTRGMTSGLQIIGAFYEATWGDLINPLRCIPINGNGV